MTDSMVVLCSCANDEEASCIAATLVEQHLAACVNVLPPVRSIYRWQEKVEHSEEFLLIIKTTQSRFPALRERIQELHSYDTAEMIALPIVDGSEKYLKWLREQL
jgi:periplasmic divalent cation tolerance protein